MRNGKSMCSSNNAVLSAEAGLGWECGDFVPMPVSGLSVAECDLVVLK
jgi:hypothetical protein